MEVPDMSLLQGKDYVRLNKADRFSASHKRFLHPRSHSLFSELVLPENMTPVSRRERARTPFGMSKLPAQMTGIGIPFYFSLASKRHESPGKMPAIEPVAFCRLSALPWRPVNGSFQISHESILPLFLVFVPCLDGKMEWLSAGMKAATEAHRALQTSLSLFLLLVITAATTNIPA